jgi:hypothetical protein
VHHRVVHGLEHLPVARDERLPHRILHRVLGRNAQSECRGP